MIVFHMVRSKYGAIFEKILVSVASTLGIAALSLCFRSIRTAIFYNRIEYDLSCQKNNAQSQLSCTWDIHWADYGLTFIAVEIAHDKIKDVTFAKLGGKNEKISEIFPSDTYKSLFDGEIQIRINSIIRQSPTSGVKTYMLRLAFRKRRFF